MQDLAVSSSASMALRRARVSFSGCSRALTLSMRTAGFLALWMLMLTSAAAKDSAAGEDGAKSHDRAKKQGGGNRGIAYTNAAPLPKVKKAAAAAGPRDGTTHSKPGQNTKKQSKAPELKPKSVAKEHTQENLSKPKPTAKEKPRESEPRIRQNPMAPPVVAKAPEPGLRKWSGEEKRDNVPHEGYRVWSSEHKKADDVDVGYRQWKREHKELSKEVANGAAMHEAYAQSKALTNALVHSGTQITPDQIAAVTQANVTSEGSELSVGSFQLESTLQSAWWTGCQYSAQLRRTDGSIFTLSLSSHSLGAATAEANEWKGTSTILRVYSTNCGDSSSPGAVPGPSPPEVWGRAGCFGWGGGGYYPMGEGPLVRRPSQFGY